MMEHNEEERELDVCTIITICAQYLIIIIISMEQIIIIISDIGEPANTGFSENCRLY
jgi:hypothetical protein